MSTFNGVGAIPATMIPTGSFPNISMQSFQDQQMARLQQLEKTNTTSPFAWVNGIEGAKAWVLPPNTVVILMDSDDNVFYRKESDGSGHMTLRMFRYEEIQEENNNTKYVTVDRFNALEKQLSDLQTALGVVGDESDE